MNRIFSFEYDNSYEPPAPLMPIVIMGYDPELPPATISAFVDSGADGTMLPRDILMKVGARYQDSVILRGTAGGLQHRDRYLVQLDIAGETIYAVHAVAIEAGDEPLIGRDVLNQLIVTLHGPANVTEVQAG